jgi:uncharacterized RDD family membrane protein YckC
MDTSPSRGIVTPEAVVLEFETAGVGSRVVAQVLDLLLEGAVLLALLLVLTLSAAGGLGGDTAAQIAAVVLIFLVLVGYPVAMETLWNGRTLGKAAMGLRVVTSEGGPIRFRHAAIRTMFALAELWAMSFVAVLSVLLTKRNQRVGDLAAGTIVLRERNAASGAVAVAFPPPPGFEGYVASLDVGRLREPQYELIRSFLLRVFELTPPARASLAVRLANPTAIAMEHAPPPMVGPELFLVCVASAYQRRSAGSWSAPPGAWGPST